MTALSPSTSAPAGGAPRFTLADAERAHDEWGANCGPGALAAIMGMTLDEVRPHMLGFESKGYTNPTMMFEALGYVGARWQLLKSPVWPNYGLARIQWEGPWTKPGVPIRARYRYTHWVGAQRGYSSIGIFDINCMNNGTGWCSLDDWRRGIVPHLVALYPRADGKWHITHAIEIAKSSGQSQ
jgi:hypothetical protein